MSTITTTVSAIPLLRHRNTVSNPADQDDFVTKYEATNDALSNNLVSEINDIGSEINIVSGEVNVNAGLAADQVTLAADQVTLAAGQVTLAEDQVTLAANSATTALANANATTWVSGTTYTLHDVVISVADNQAYRRIVAGAGTTDPANDIVNWEIINDVSLELVQATALYF